MRRFGHRLLAWFFGKFVWSLRSSRCISTYFPQGSWARTCGAFDTKLFQVLSLVFLILVTIITMGLMRRMSKEDEALRKEFHQDWDEWAELVPCKLIPGVY